MPANTFDNYLKFITPTAGDPTYSLLKAHLLFEELLRAYLHRSLAHPEALKGARLSFVQLLSIARAINAAPTEHWCWIAIEKLNKLRNMLAHEAAPKALSEKLNEYISFVVSNSGVPLPQPGHASAERSAAPPQEPLYLAVDLATIGLYSSVSGLLGFDATAGLIGINAYAQSLRSLTMPPRTPAAG